MKKQPVFIVLFFLFFILTYGQDKMTQKNESMIIMSEADISSLAKTLDEYKQKKISKRVNTKVLSINNKLPHQPAFNLEVDFLKSEILKLQQQLANVNSNRQYATNAISTRESYGLKKLEDEVAQLKKLLHNASSRKENTDLVYVTPYSQNTPKPTQKEIIVKEQANPTHKEDETVRAKLDSLNALFKLAQQHNYNEDFTTLQSKIDALKNELLAKNNMPTPYETLVNKFKNYNRIAYFANNSVLLNSESQKIIDELVTILNENTTLDVIVKGFASNKGNALYNEDLSIKRTEAVKKALMLKGIHPARILTQYHGIDYSAATDAKARRVELGILVRK